MKKAKDLEFLSKLEIINGWNFTTRQKLVGEMGFKNYKADAVVYNIKNVAETFFIVKSGVLEMSTELEMEDFN